MDKTTDQAPLDLDAIQARAEAAERELGDFIFTKEMESGELLVRADRQLGQATAAFLTHGREDVLRLVAEIKQQQRS